MLLLFLGAGLGLVLFLPAIRRGSARILFRALVPAWRYFDREEPVPVLWFRCGGDSQNGHWQRVSRSQVLRPVHFFCNPAGNLVLLEDSLLRLGVSDEAVLRPWIVERVQKEARILGGESGAGRVQYRIDLEDPATGQVIRTGEIQETPGDSS